MQRSAPAACRRFSPGCGRMLKLAGFERPLAGRNGQGVVRAGRITYNLSTETAD